MVTTSLTLGLETQVFPLTAGHPVLGTNGRFAYSLDCLLLGFR